MLELLRKEDGAVAVLIGLALLTLLVTSATVVDAGALYWEKRQVQTAADGAALAAVFDLAEGKGSYQAQVTAAQYVGDNLPGKNAQVDFQVVGSNKARVAVTTNPDLFIAPVIGVRTAAVHASATAKYGVADKVTNLVPFMVPQYKVAPHTGAGNPGVFEFGDDRPLPGPEKGTQQKGYFWLSDFDGGANGTPAFDSWIRDGYKGEVGVGDIENGTGMKTALKGALEDRMATDPLIVLPVYKATEGGGDNGKYKTVGFVEFHINSFDLQGSPKSITGYFTTGTVTTGFDSDDDGANYGVMAINLVE